MINIPYQPTPAERNGKNKSKPSRKNKTFYIALGICTVAVAAAGWTTYKSVRDIGASTEHFKASQNENHRSRTLARRASQGNRNSFIQNQEHEAHSSHITSTPEFSPPPPIEKVVEEPAASPVSAKPEELLIIYPASNTVIKDFSAGKPVKSKTFGDWRTHMGTDFKAEKGSRVKAASSGTVKDIYNDENYGWTVVIEHDGKFTMYYSGLGETILVKKGVKIKAGDEIGSVGIVPCEAADEPHVHIMAHKNNEFVDPMLILEKEAD